MLSQLFLLDAVCSCGWQQHEDIQEKPRVKHPLCQKCCGDVSVAHISLAATLVAEGVAIVPGVLFDLDGAAAVAF